MTIPLHYAWRNAWARPSATLATVTGLALLVFVLSTSRMLAAGVRHAMIDSGRDDRAIVLALDAFSEDSSRLQQAMPALVAAAPGVARSSSGAPLIAAESVVHLPFARAGAPEHIASLQVRGVGQNVLEVRPNVRVVRGRALHAGTLEAMIGSAVAGQYEGLQVGDAFELEKGRGVRVVGVFEAGGSAQDSEIWVDGDVLRAALGWQGSFSSVTARLTSVDALAAFAAQLRADKQHGSSVEPERAYYRRLGNDFARLITNLGWLVASVFSLGAMLSAMITVDAAVAERRRELAVLKTIGFGSAEVLLALLFEAAVVALAGATLGVSLASLAPLIDFSTTNAATGQEVAFRFLPGLESLGVAFLLGTLVGIAGSSVPALQAALTDPLRGLRD